VDLLFWFFATRDSPTQATLFAKTLIVLKGVWRVKRELRPATLSENGVQLDYGYYRKLLKYQEIVSVRLYELCISQQAFSIIELQTKKQCIAVGVADEACLQKATAVLMERGVTEIFDERGQAA
jgi:hypothetical protein